MGTTTLQKLFSLFRVSAALPVLYQDSTFDVPTMDTRGAIFVQNVINGTTSANLVLAGTDDTDNQATTPLVAASPALQVVMSRLYGYDNVGNNWDRLRTLPDNADGQASLGIGLVGVVARLQGINVAGNFERIRSDATNADNFPGYTSGGLITNSMNRLWGGNEYDRQRSASGSTQDNFNAHVGIAAVALAGNWSINSDPAVNTVASVTRAAGPDSIRHICTSIHASLSAGATASGIVKVYLRDGASGVGTILWSSNLAVTIGTSATISISGLSIRGAPATAMTLEFSVAGGLTTQENVSLTGYSVR